LLPHQIKNSFRLPKIASDMKKILANHAAIGLKLRRRPVLIQTKSW